jgi:Spy/CpxP family protein refolding chaperone
MNKNRIRLLALGAGVSLALATTAPLSAFRAGAAQEEHAQETARSPHVPTVDEHMKLLTSKLELTADQQTTIRPMLQELHDTTQKLVDDQSLSHEDRMAGVRTARMKADKDIRTVLTDDQKQKLDQVEHEPHPELHGDVHGSR